MSSPGQRGGGLRLRGAAPTHRAPAEGEMVTKAGLVDINKVIVIYLDLGEIGPRPGWLGWAKGRFRG